MGYTSAKRPAERIVSEADAAEQSEVDADEGDWAGDEVKSSGGEDNSDSLEADNVLIRHEQEDAETSGSGVVKQAILTDDVVEVCSGDLVCERLSNADNTLAGSSFQDIQDLLDSMKVAPGRPGMWG